MGSKDMRKTKAELADELADLRRRLKNAEKRSARLKRAGEELKKTHDELKERLSFLISASPAVIYSAEASGNYAATFISKNAKEQTGYEPSQFVDDPDFWAGHVHPEERKRVLAGMSKIFEDDYCEHEYRFLYKDGTYHWMRDRSKLIRDADGATVEIIGSWEDVTWIKKAEQEMQRQSRELETAYKGLEKKVGERTAELSESNRELEKEVAERKQAGEELRKSEEKYRAVFEQAADSIVLIDTSTGELVEFNDRTHQNLGYTREEFERLTIPEFEVIASAAEVEKHFRKIIETGSDVFETKHRTKGGEVRDIHVSSKAIALEGKDFIQTIWRDISDRKRAEEALKNERDYLIGVFGAMEDGVYIVDRDHDIKYVNPALIRDFGEYLGRKCHEYFIGLSEPCPECKMEEVLSGETARREWYSERNNKTYDLLDSPLKNPDGGVSKITIFRDITDRKQIEEERLRSGKLESVGILAGGIAHDFNNILTGIMGNISLARMRLPENVQAAELLGESEAACMRAAGLTRQLLTFAKGGEPVVEAASISELIRQSVEFSLRGSNVKCDFSLPDDLWPARVDPGQIGQVVNNLIINADQAMPEGGVIKVTAENLSFGAPPPLEDGEYIRITIEDQGVGIPNEYLPKIFDPFFTTKEKGSGLGLATSYSIVNKHRGLIAVDSEPGKGTVFTIHLPASSEEAARDGARVEVEDVKLQGARVLVMDDEEIVRSLAARVLGRLGCEVEEAEDGEEAVDKYLGARASGRPFDAVIIDLTIPGGMGGQETIKRLIDIDPEVKAIVASGYSNDPVMANHEDYGFSGMVAKPFKVEELSSLLIGLVKTRKQ